jgi:hypothetical protein
LNAFANFAPEVSLSDWLAHSPIDMVAETLNLDPSVIAQFPSIGPTLSRRDSAWFSSRSAPLFQGAMTTINPAHTGDKARPFSQRRRSRVAVQISNIRQMRNRHVFADSYFASYLDR